MERAKSILAKNWLSLKKPTDYFLVSLTDNTAVFRVEPLEKGFGVTLGNVLRRVMLSSLQGIAVTAVKIEGVDHEYSTIPGVKEDVVDIILNLKSLVLKSATTERRKLRLKAEGPCTVTAGMIELVGDVEVVNQSLVICHLDHSAQIDMELIINSGKGYVSSDYNKTDDLAMSTIAIDSIFSPVKRVNYKVENSRVGAETEFDRLYLTVETNGAISPDLALALSAKIVQEQLQVFISFVDVEPVKESEEDKLPFDYRLLTRVENLELSVRSQNCLKNENIVYIGDLVTKSEVKMLQTPNFGKKSLTEIKDLLSKMNLRFGMEVQGWPPENVEELAKKYEEENHS